MAKVVGRIEPTDGRAVPTMTSAERRAALGMWTYKAGCWLNLALRNARAVNGEMVDLRMDKAEVEIAVEGLRRLTAILWRSEGIPLPEEIMRPGLSDRQWKARNKARASSYPRRKPPEFDVVDGDGPPEAA